MAIAFAPTREREGGDGGEGELDGRHRVFRSCEI